MAVRNERKRRFNKIMEKNTAAAEKIAREEIAQTSGGGTDFTNPLEGWSGEHPNHRWINSKDVCTSNGQYSELECSVCGKVTYVFNGNPISKQEFYEVWNYNNR